MNIKSPFCLLACISAMSFNLFAQPIDKAVSESAQTSSNANQFVTLTFHDVRDDVAAKGDRDYYAISSQNFAQFLQWIKDNNALSPTIIKCDIEGAEYEFIESLSDEFFDNIHTFIVEYHVAGGRHYLELLKRFFNLGYKIHYNYKNALEIDRGTFIAQRH